MGLDGGTTSVFPSSPGERTTFLKSSQEFITGLICSVGNSGGLIERKRNGEVGGERGRRLPVRDCRKGFHGNP